MRNVEQRTRLSTWRARHQRLVRQPVHEREHVRFRFDGVRARIAFLITPGVAWSQDSISGNTFATRELERFRDRFLQCRAAHLAALLTEGPRDVACERENGSRI